MYLVNSGDISSKTNIWPISNLEYVYELQHAKMTPLPPISKYHEKELILFHAKLYFSNPSVLPDGVNLNFSYLI